MRVYSYIGHGGCPVTYPSDWHMEEKNGEHFRVMSKSSDKLPTIKLTKENALAVESFRDAQLVKPSLASAANKAISVGIETMAAPNLNLKKSWRKTRKS